MPVIEFSRDEGTYPFLSLELQCVMLFPNEHSARESALATLVLNRLANASHPDEVVAMPAHLLRTALWGPGMPSLQETKAAIAREKGWIASSILLELIQGAIAMAELRSKTFEVLIEAFGEHRAREILAAIARPPVLAEFDRITALRLAVRLHAEQEPRPVIRDRLVLRGMSNATAYRLMNRMLSTPSANCLTEGGAMRRKPATVAPWDHSAPHAPDRNHEQ
jgi:hypothetical protein